MATWSVEKSNILTGVTVPPSVPVVMSSKIYYAKDTSTIYEYDPATNTDTSIGTSGSNFDSGTLPGLAANPYVNPNLAVLSGSLYAVVGNGTTYDWAVYRWDGTPGSWTAVEQNNTAFAMALWSDGSYLVSIGYNDGVTYSGVTNAVRYSANGTSWSTGSIGGREIGQAYGLYLWGHTGADSNVRGLIAQISTINSDANNVYSFSAGTFSVALSVASGASAYDADGYNNWLLSGSNWQQSTSWSGFADPSTNPDNRPMFAQGFEQSIGTRDNGSNDEQIAYWESGDWTNAESIGTFQDIMTGVVVGARGYMFARKVATTNWDLMERDEDLPVSSGTYTHSAGGLPGGIIA